VTTKAQDAASAMADNAAVLENTLVLVVQNGLDGMAIALEAAHSSDIVGGLAMFAASFLSPGEITITTAGATYLGGEAADRVAAILDPVMPIEVVTNFAGAQWTKLLINQVNALPAITGLSVQETIADHRLRRTLTASMRETVITGLACGVRFETLHNLSHNRLVLFAALPLLLGQWIPLQMAARMGDVPNPGSTLQSVRRGQPTEVDYLNGAVVAQAEAIGRTARINSDITALVHEVESSGEFIPVTEVVRRVRR
jgi:2-dehydropantoate 2-reductase